MMEDAATAEISRSQLWHWAYHGAATTAGAKITVPYIDGILDEETAMVKKTGLDPKRVDLSARYLKDQIRAKALSDFLTSDLTCVVSFVLRCVEGLMGGTQGLLGGVRRVGTPREALSEAEFDKEFGASSCVEICN